MGGAGWMGCDGVKGYDTIHFVTFQRMYLCTLIF